MYRPKNRDKKLISKRQVAELFGVSTHTIDCWLHDGKLPEPERTVLWTRWDCEKLIARTRLKSRLRTFKHGSTNHGTSTGDEMNEKVWKTQRATAGVKCRSRLLHALRFPLAKYLRCAWRRTTNARRDPLRHLPGRHRVDSRPVSSASPRPLSLD